MAIAFRSKGAWVAGTTSISMTMPTTHAAGDLLLMFIHTCNNAITTAPGNGWQLLSPSPVSTGTANTALGVRLTVYWKIAQSSSESAQTVAVTGGTATNGITVAYSGVDNTTPFDLTPVSAVQATSLANLSFPTLTTVTDGAMIVNAVALDNDTASSAMVTSPVNASLTGVTRQHGQTVSTSTGGGICFIDGIKTTAGLISATTATVAAAARAYLTIALRPILPPTEVFAVRAGATSESRVASIQGAVNINAVRASASAAQRIASVDIAMPVEIIAVRAGATSGQRIATIGIGAMVGAVRAGANTGQRIGIIIAACNFTSTRAAGTASAKIAEISAGVNLIMPRAGATLASRIATISALCNVLAIRAGGAVAGRVAIISASGAITIEALRAGATASTRIAQLSGEADIQAIRAGGVAAARAASIRGEALITAVRSGAFASMRLGTIQILTDVVIVGVRRGITYVVHVAHGRPANRNKQSGTLTTSQKRTGIYRVNNKMKGTVKIDD